MTTTAVIRGGANTHLAVQKWSKALFKFSWANDPLRPFIGKGPNNIIELKNDLMGTAGDKVQFDIFALLVGSGEGDDGVYETNEEAMISYFDTVFIHERGNSIKLNGKMTEKRTIHNLRTQARYQLGTWLQRKRSADVICALSGVVAATFAGQITGAIDTDSSSVQIATVSNGVKVSPVKGAAALRWFGGGQTILGTIERVATDLLVNSVTDNLFGTRVISYVKRMAERTISDAGVAISPISPIMVKGKKHYIMFIEPYQALQLKKEAAWLQAQREANIRGESNPIFSGALGMWDGVIIHESQLIHRRTGAGTSGIAEEFEADDVLASGMTLARALFCGSQAALLAQGQYPTYVEKIHDYKTKAGYHTDVIYGVKKTVFNSIDFGVITVDTAINLSAS
jgi:hypothetical protein